jgi:hypothetical protein
MIRDNGTFIMMQNKNIIRIALATALILMVPLVAMQFTNEVNWDLFGTGLTYELVARKGDTIAYRAAVGIACAAGLLLVWINAAVGIIGDEDLANVMYFGVLAVGLIGAFIARFQPRGMARALVATAVAQALVPLIAMIWVPLTAFTPSVGGVLGLNAFFIALWVGSALLFRHAGSPWVRGEERGSLLR